MRCSKGVDVMRQVQKLRFVQGFVTDDAFLILSAIHVYSSHVHVCIVSAKHLHGLLVCSWSTLEQPVFWRVGGALRCERVVQSSASVPMLAFLHSGMPLGACLSICATRNSRMSPPGGQRPSNLHRMITSCNTTAWAAGFKMDIPHPVQHLATHDRP